MSDSSTPGAPARIASASSGEIGRSNSALIDSECPVNTGTRTQVTDTGNVGELEDLAALVAELLLLVRLEGAVVDERAGERDHVERDRPGELGRRGEVDRVAVERECRGAVDDLAHLLVELGDAGEARARHRLVGADDEPLAARPRGAAA